LRKTDALARAALQPAIDAGLPTNLRTGDQTAHVLTYFNQVTHIRLIPYYPLFLVGVPFSSIHDGVTLDYCAIPHELAHVLYLVDKNVNSGGLIMQRAQGARLFRRASSPLFPALSRLSNDWYKPWLEEMFADVYGCIVAGPFIARHFMALSKGWKQSELIANPGSHPSPLIRPYVYIEALAELDARFLGGSIDSVTQTLRDEWDDFVKQQGAEVALADDVKKPVRDAVAEIKEAVQDILLAIVPEGNALSAVAPWPDRSTWVAAASGSLPEPAVTPAGDMAPGVDLPAALDKAAAGVMIEAMTGGMSPNSATGAIPAEQWRKILQFPRWLDKGPEGGKAH
jgi:hypothetical protein